MIFMKISRPSDLHGELHGVGEEVGEVLEPPGHHLQVLPSVVTNTDRVLRVTGTVPAQGIVRYLERGISSIYCSLLYMRFV